MSLEVATYISDLVATNPTGSDNASTGDDHSRLIKSTIKNTFPNVSGAVTPTHTELNYVDGVTSAIQTQLDAKLASSGYTAADVLSKLLTVDGTGSGVDADLLDGVELSALGGNTTGNVGYLNIPQNAQNGNYTLVLTDAGKAIHHASGAGSGDTYTIPANASVAFPINTVVTFVNRDSNAVSIAITSDILLLAGTTTVGTRTLAQNGVATAIKVESNVWIISGPGLS